MNKINILLIPIFIALGYISHHFFDLKNFIFLNRTSKQFSDIDIQRVMDYPIPKVLARYQKDYNVTPDAAKEHEKELKRYFIMGEAFPEEGFEMYSDEIDNLWHTFLLFTKDYQKFCRVNFGHFIHHNPIDNELTES